MSAKKKRDEVPAIEKSINLLMLCSLKGLKQKEQIDLLDRAGFGQGEIAHLLSTTSKNVSVRLVEIRRARKKLPKKAIGA